MTVKWKIVIEKVKDILVYFQGEGIKPTLRGVFYKLGVDDSLPNTESMYKTLSHRLSLEKKAGTFPFDALIDNSRRSIENFSDGYLEREDLESVKVGCIRKIQNLTIDNVIEDYFNYENLILTPPPDGYWAKQPIVPEIWTEKDAIVGILEQITSGLHTTIRINRGYAGWAYLNTSIEKVKEVLKSHDKISILYLGDLDPSGVDMDRHLKDAFKYLDITDRIDFKRIALTEDQVDLHNLPPKPKDTKTLEKLQKDPRYKNYDFEYYAEVDAFAHLAPNSFKALIKAEIQKCHDSTIAAEVAAENIKLVDECKATRAESIKHAKRVLLNQIKGEKNNENRK